MVSDEQLETMVANSYRNFHAKGLDYLCILRDRMMTIKAYFYDGIPENTPELINPHDHRYSFDTVVLSGAMINNTYEPAFGKSAERYDQYNWMTPLNGGNGFTHVGETSLRQTTARQLESGDSYNSDCETIHTIKILRPQTILLLTQYEDELPLRVPTRTFVPANSPTPSLSGLYDRMTADRARELIDILESKGWKI